MNVAEVYGFEFPDELYDVWSWHQGLRGDAAKGLRVLGLTLHGPFEVLAGKLDGLTLRYPGVLHWRYQRDLPELFTVFVGNTGDLHWGYWFDDPERLPPVVASFYARDGVHLVPDDSLWHALATRVVHVRESIREARRFGHGSATESQRDLALLDELEATMPKPKPRVAAVAPRVPIAATPDGMGIVCAPSQLGAVPNSDDLDAAELLGLVAAELAAGRPGSALLLGRRRWDGQQRLALAIFERAYAALGREPLRAVAIAHRAHPALPSLDLATYQAGDFTELTAALAQAPDVATLSLHPGSALDGDWSTLVNLRELVLAGMQLTDLPPTLAACTRLERLQMFNNAITEIPPWFCNFTALRMLDIGASRVTSLDSLTRCTALEHLAISHCPIATLPADLTCWPKLRQLTAERTLLPATEHDRLRTAIPGVQIIGDPAPARTASTTPYSPKSTYRVNDSISHPTFGVGTVASVAGDGRITVRFHVGAKTLAAARAAAR